jgi:hypothetical protein
MTIPLKALHDNREQLKTDLAQIRDLRPGSLTARFRKCGKPNCHCAQKDSPGHGPSYSLTHASAGKTITQVIPQGPAVDRTRAQIAEYRRFRKLVQELIAVSEQLCNAQLQQPEAIVAAGSKKKNSSPISWPATSYRRLRRCLVVRRWKTWIWRCGNRSCWREPQSSNASTPTPAMSEARELLVVVGKKRAWSDAEASRCRAFSVLSNWSAPTIIALPAATASALAMGIWA